MNPHRPVLFLYHYISLIRGLAPHHGVKSVLRAWLHPDEIQISARRRSHEFPVMSSRVATKLVRFYPLIVFLPFFSAPFK